MYIKLCKESISFSKRLLDTLSKKDVEPQLLNQWLVPISKLLVVLCSKSNFDRHYFRYMKQSQLHIDQFQLNSLNAVLIDLAPNIYAPLAKKSQFK